MAKVIAIANQKGGVGKTSSTVNLGVGLRRQGAEVLLIDLDAQANLTMSFGIEEPDQLPYTISSALEKAISEETIILEEGIIQTAENVDLMPANIELSGYEMRLINEYGRESLLKQYIETVRLQVLIVEPGKVPYPKEIGEELEDLQQEVSGYIETVYPFPEEDAVLICNEEGKLDGLPLNRSLKDEEGTILDIIAGTFLIAGTTEDSFCSLTDSQITKYTEQFHSP